MLTWWPCSQCCQLNDVVPYFHIQYFGQHQEFLFVQEFEILQSKVLKLPILINNVRFPTVWFCWFLTININIHTICLSMNSAMFFIITEGCPYIPAVVCQSSALRPAEDPTRNTCLVVTMPSFTWFVQASFLAATVTWPEAAHISSHKRSKYLQASENGR